MPTKKLRFVIPKVFCGVLPGYTYITESRRKLCSFCVEDNLSLCSDEGSPDWHVVDMQKTFKKVCDNCDERMKDEM